MSSEVELIDGGIQGECSFCGDSIIGRRLPGGLGLLCLKAMLVEQIGEAELLPSFADDLDRVEGLLREEEKAMAAARRLMETARLVLTNILSRD